MERQTPDEIARIDTEKLEAVKASGEIDGWFRNDELEFLARAAREAPEKGVIVEVGVYKGRSATVLDRVRNGRPLYLIDNFAMQTADCSDWPPESSFVHHYLCDPTELETWCVPIALLHQDADHTFQVVWEHLEHLGPRVVVGGRIALHDYGDPSYPGVQKAWEMYSERHKFKLLGGRGHLVIFEREEE